MLNLVDAIPRLKANEDRVNTFVNGLGYYTADDSSRVKTLPQFNLEHLNYAYQGAWITATQYQVSNLILKDGIVYQCAELHTSGTFATDLAAGKWFIFQGVPATVGTYVAFTGSVAIGTTKSVSTLSAALAADADAGVSLILLNGPVTLSADWAPTKPLKIDAGGVINTNGHTLTFTALPLAGDYQIFAGTGTLSLPAGTIRAAWFGPFTGTAAANKALVDKVIASTPEGATIVWPVGTIQINAEIAQTKGAQNWESAAGSQIYPTYDHGPFFGTTFQQTVNTNRVLNITGSGNTFKGLVFDGNGTSNDVVYVGASSTGSNKFLDCAFIRGSATDTLKAALNIEAISTTIDSCYVTSNDGTGIRLGDLSNVTSIIGGSVTSNARAGTAGTAGIVCDSGNTSEIHNTTVELNGKSGAPTTGGILINNSGRLTIRAHFERNLNYQIRAVNITAGNYDIRDSYFISDTIAPTTTAILLEGGPKQLSIFNNYSTGHTNFMSITGTVDGLVVERNTVLDTNYLKELAYVYSAARNWSFLDLLHSPQNMFKYPAPSGWSTGLSGASKWEHTSTVKYNDTPSILINRDGTSNAYAIYTIPIAAGSNLRGNWVTVSFVACTDAGTDHAMLYTLTDGVTTANTGVQAGANYNWMKWGGSIKVDPAATSLTIVIGGGVVSGNTYVSGLTLSLGINTNFLVDNPQYGEYLLPGAPTTGTWELGDRVVNSCPAVGQPKAWRCTVAGSPGTWVSEGNL